MIKKIVKYETMDGQVFDSFDEAFEHEARLNRIAKIEALIHQVSGIDGETIKISELAYILGVNQGDVIKLLNQIIDHVEQRPAAP